MNSIQVSAVVDGISPLKDGGMSVRFHTQEMQDDQKLVLLKIHRKFGWMLFKESETPFSEEELPKYDPKEFDELKSPSQRLQAVIFCFARDIKKIPKEDKVAHRQFYEQEMERIINAYKAKLP